MNRLIVFVIDIPVNDSLITYYRMDVLKNGGFGIRIIDISPVVNKNADFCVKRKVPDDISTIVCYTYADIKAEICAIPGHSIVFISFGNEYKHCFVLQRLAKTELHFGSMALNSIYEGKTIKKNRKSFPLLSISRIVDYLYRRIPLSVLGIRPRDFFITNSEGEIENHKQNLCGDRTKFLVVNSNAYDEALKGIKKERIITKPYCVWLDTYSPYHPDLTNLKIELDADNYYKPLRELFHWIETTYGLAVIVAAHPKAEYELHEDAYPGFHIIKNCTGLLVRDAEFVLTAISTSFMYALVYMKPMIFINQDEVMKKLPQHADAIQQLSVDTGQKEIELEHFNAMENKKELFDECISIDEKRYIAMGRNYLARDFDGTLSGKTSDSLILDFLGAL